MGVDFERLLLSQGVKIDTERCSPGWVAVRCPLCGDRDFHGAFNPVEEFYNCWRCGGTGDVIGVLQKLLRLGFPEVKTLLDKYSGRMEAAARLQKRSPSAKSIKLPGSGGLEPMYRKYLRRRGFSPAEIVARYAVQGGPIVGDWKYRLIIPIIYNGKVVSFQGRDITGRSDIKYKTLDVESSVMDAKSVVYGADGVQGDRVMVTEGVMDAWRVGPGAIAVFGVGMTAAQVRFISRRWSQVVFVFDPEDEAQRRARKYAAQIAALGASVEVLDTELDHDPGSMTRAEVNDLRAAAGFPPLST